MLAGANCLLLVNSKYIYCRQKVTESNLTKIFFIILSICSLIETDLLPAGGAGEKGSVVDGGDGLIHERIRLDESQSFVREIGGWLVGGGWSLASAAAWPARQQQSERERKKKKALDINLVPQADVKTLAAVCFWEEQEEKTGALCGCLF